jgi:plasmid stability protein
MTNHKYVEFRIRHLDDDIHHQLKIRAVIEKKTMNQIIIEALAAYVKPLIRIRPK